MIVSILLVIFLIAITFYVHQHLIEKQQQHNLKLAPIRIPPSYNNYNEILIDTPIESPITETNNGSIRRVRGSVSAEEDDDVISMGTQEDAMSMVSLEEDETLVCNKGRPVEMPRGLDQYQTTNDNARHVFSAQEQMRVFDRHDFVKDIGNNRVNVDPGNSFKLPSIRNPNEPTECIGPVPIGVSSLAGYGTLMAGYGNNAPIDGGYMSGVVPYQG
jgi:hypothetical protein